MVNPITTVNVSVLTAPVPSLLQKTGALISWGATTTALLATTFLTQLSDLTPLLQGGITLASLTQSAGVATGTLATTTIASATYNTTTGLVTLTLTAGLTLAPGMLIAVSGATGTGSFASINGTQICGAGTTGTTVTYTIATGLTMTITGGNAAQTFGLANGATFLTTIAGATPAAYNGTVSATMATSTTFTYAVPSGTASPATGTITATPPSVAELTAMATTWFAQGSSQGVYVLECGGLGIASGGAIANLSTYLSTTNPGFFYFAVVPRNWDAVAAFLTLIASYEALTSKFYFFVTTTTGNYTNYTAAMKDVFWLVEAPGRPNAEFTVAWPAQVVARQSPSPSQRVPPMAFTYGFGVTPWPQAGNQTTLTAILAANGNFCGTGAQGGISTSVLYNGTTADGQDMLKWWYGIDWTQSQSQLTLNNYVLNGNNNLANPLFYNQDGINQLQGAEASLLKTGVGSGILLGAVLMTSLDQATFNQNVENGVYANQTALNAVPFITYTQGAPNDYAAGKYAGLSVAMTPQLGFKQIIFNIDVTNFVAAAA